MENGIWREIGEENVSALGFGVGLFKMESENLENGQQNGQAQTGISVSST